MNSVEQNNEQRNRNMLTIIITLRIIATLAIANAVILTKAKLTTQNTKRRTISKAKATAKKVAYIGVG